MTATHTTQQRHLRSKVPTGVVGPHRVTASTLPRGSTTLIWKPTGTGTTLLIVEFLMQAEAVGELVRSQETGHHGRVKESRIRETDGSASTGYDLIEAWCGE